MSPKGTKYGVFEVFNPLYVHVSCMSSGVNMIVLSHDGELMLMCHMGFTHMNMFSVGCRHILFRGLCGIINAPDAFVSTVSSALTVANLTTPLTSVGKGYSLCTVNGPAGLSGTTMDRPLGVTYDDRLA